MAAAKFSSDVLQNFYSPLSRGQNRNLPEPLQPELLPVRDVFKISQSNFQEWLRVWIMNVSKTNPNNKDIFMFKRENKEKYTNLIEQEILICEKKLVKENYWDSLPVYTKGLISEKEKYQGQYHKRCFFNEKKNQMKELKQLGCEGTEEGEFEIIILKKPEQKDKRKAKQKTNCYLCQKPLLQKYYRDAVKDHCHLTGNYRGAAHNACNLKLRINPNKDQIPVVFHNLRGYDAHHLMQAMANLQKEVKCVANNMEKYITISVDGLRFIDSLNFLQGSLDSLVKATPKEALKIISTISNGSDLLYKKGI